MNILKSNVHLRSCDRVSLEHRGPSAGAARQARAIRAVVPVGRRADTASVEHVSERVE